MLPSRAPSDRGSVTAELAIGLTGVAVVLVALLTTVTAAQAQLQVVDAAGAGARAAARGESHAEVAEIARRLAGPSAVTAVRLTGATATVEVSARVRMPLPGAPGLTVRGRAVTPAEPQVAAP